MMDAFVMKCDDAESIVKQQTELHVKKIPLISEPPVKKIKHDEHVIIENGEEVEDLESSLNNSKDKDLSSESVSSEGRSDESPERKAADNSDSCNGTKEKASSPKPKRRKLSIEEIEERRKAKEEAKLAREQKRQEKVKKDQEKEELRLKREKEKQAKKEQLEKERIEKQLRKEKLEKERLEKQKKKEEMNLVKEEERKKKEEERKQKEEEKKLKEEEKRKKEEERKMKEEEEQRKKDKAKESFKSFFIKKSPPKKIITVDEKCQMFAPFEVKPNMKMAPIVRRTPVQNSTFFSETIEKQDSADLYLCELKKKRKEHKIEYITGRTLRIKEKSNESCKGEEDEDIEIVDNEEETEKENKHVMRVKLLQFSENYRPPYYGTWRKRSKSISGRNPFKKDEELLSYEIDSDEEWEEEEPGESLSGPENEDEDEEDDENDEENDGFFVPHGYLSDDEGVHDSDGEKQEENVDIRDKKLDKTEGFPFEGKRKFKQLRATCFGSAWFDSPDQVPDFLAIYKINPIATLPVDILSVKERKEQSETNQEESSTKILAPTTTPRSTNNVPLKVPEEAMPLLINFVHKNSFGMSKLILKFLDIWDKKRNDNGDQGGAVHAKISKRQLERKILEIAKRDAIGDNGKSCYIVHEHILQQYGCEFETSYTNSTKTVNEKEVPLVSGTDTCNNSSLIDGNKNTLLCPANHSSIPDASEKAVDDSTIVAEANELSDLTYNSSSDLHADKDELKDAQIQRKMITI